MAPTLELLDLPFPLFSGGLALDSPQAVDDLYADLLGCTPLYTGSYAGKTTLKKLSFREDIRNTVKDFLLGPLLTSVHAIRTLDAIYEFSANRDRSSLPASYQQVARRQTIGQGTFEWQHNTFLDRRRLYMSRYLQDHKLKLGVRSATAGIKVQGMEPRTFAVMTPADPGKKVGTLRFDDSLFCKLPNPPELLKQNAGDDAKTDKGISAAQSGLGNLGGLDKELLTTAGRQKFMLNYSNKHFGSRAFDGS